MMMDALDRLDQFTGASGGAGGRKADPLRLMSKAERMALLRARAADGAVERSQARKDKRTKQTEYQRKYRAGEIETRPYVRKQSHTSKDS